MRTPTEFPARVPVVRADVRDPDSVRAAVAGHDVVVCAIGPSGRRPLGLYSEGARALVAAMGSAGVGRVIAITSGGVRRDDPNFGFWYRTVLRPLAEDLYADMRLMESTFRDSGLDWTFVRPSHLQDKPPTGDYRVQDGVTPKGGWKVSRTDVARFIAGEVDAREWSRKAPTIAE